MDKGQGGKYLILPPGYKEKPPEGYIATANSNILPPDYAHTITYDWTSPNRIHRIDEALKIMAEKRLLNLPVKVNGTVGYSITRHDLLRAWIGLGVDIESNIAP